MTATVIRKTSLTCDHPECENKFTVGGNDIAHARQAAEKHGWTSIPVCVNIHAKETKDYCPDHAEAAKEAVAVTA